MKFSEYQKQASKTAIFPSELKLLYPALGLCGESGEVAELVKKAYRDSGGKLSPEKLSNLAHELGDVLWYLSALADAINIPLEEVAKMNLEKLASRKKRDKISGSGDHR